MRRAVSSSMSGTMGLPAKLVDQALGVDPGLRSTQKNGIGDLLQGTGEIVRRHHLMHQAEMQGLGGR